VLTVIQEMLRIEEAGRLRVILDPFDEKTRPSIGHVRG